MPLGSTCSCQYYPMATQEEWDETLRWHNRSVSDYPLSFNIQSHPHTTKNTTGFHDYGHDQRWVTSRYDKWWMIYKVFWGCTLQGNPNSSSFQTVALTTLLKSVPHRVPAHPTSCQCVPRTPCARENLIRLFGWGGVVGLGGVSRAADVGVLRKKLPDLLPKNLETQK